MVKIRRLAIVAEVAPVAQAITIFIGLTRGIRVKLAVVVATQFIRAQIEGIPCRQRGRAVAWLLPSAVVPQLIIPNVVSIRIVVVQDLRYAGCVGVRSCVVVASVGVGAEIRAVA